MDEAGSWDNLRERLEAYQPRRRLFDGRRLRQLGRGSNTRSGEIGIHHHIAGTYLLQYAQERSWRGDNRRLSNGERVNRLAALSLKRGKSVDFGGYWQRHSKDVHA